jgi:alkanesulfonate monooxygenase
MQRCCRKGLPKSLRLDRRHALVDPCLVSQVILQNTKKLCPLVAVQPAYMHPYAVAKIVSSLAHLYERRIYLNMVVGGEEFSN